MNIALPPNFFYSANNNGKAFVTNGVLYIQGNINFENLMYTLTYVIKGYETCFYCGRELEPTKRTLDHMYPRVFGGVSLPENLVPCCKNCNNTKSCMTRKQYKKYRTFRSKNFKKTIFQKMFKANQFRYKKRILLPREWITDYAINIISDDIDFNRIRFDPVRMKKVEDFYKENHHYPRPVIVSANDWVLEGLHIIGHAYKHSIPTVPAIILDNVRHISR